MKALLIATLLISSLSAMADANSCFKKQVDAAAQNVSSYDFKNNVKHLNDGIKNCRKLAADEKKAASAIKRKAKLVDQIKKLQLKLTSSK